MFALIGGAYLVLELAGLSGDPSLRTISLIVSVLAFCIWCAFDWRNIGTAIDLAKARALLARSEVRVLGQSTIMDLGDRTPTLRLAPESHEVNEKLNELQETQVRIIRHCGGGADDLDLRVAEWNAYWSKHSVPRNWRDDPNVVLFDHPDLLSSVRDAWKCDYRTIVGARETFGRKFFCITGNVLVVLGATRKILLHHRNNRKSADAPSNWHLFGGHLDPSIDGGDLRDCATRELYEETHLWVALNRCPVILQRESDYGVSMVTFLGATVNETDGLLSPTTSEGTASPIDIDGLPDHLSTESWVDSGRQAVLAWLALGAPVGGRLDIYDRGEIAELYKACVSALKARSLLPRAAA